MDRDALSSHSLNKLTVGVYSTLDAVLGTRKTEKAEKTSYSKGALFTEETENYKLRKVLERQSTGCYKNM